MPQVAAIGGPFSLTDQNGRTVTDQDLKGRPFLVFFGYTNCPDFCPTTMFEISEVLRKLGPDGDRTRALFITVDPERDTPAALKDYVSSFDPRIIALTGEPEAIAAVAKAYRAYYRARAAEGRRLHHGPPGPGLSDGQGRALRVAVQPQPPARRVGGGTAQISLSRTPTPALARRASRL